MSQLDPQIRAYYDQGREAARLTSGGGQLEFVRTQELLRRVLPPPPAAIADIGGGAGIHATWLAADGYRVVLIDPVPLHAEQARDAARSTDAFHSVLGDARAVPLQSASVDAAVMLGPLYHLPEETDRVAAWREAGRVVRPGGVVAAAVISRFASLFDGLWRRWLSTEPEFRTIVDQDLRDGRHENPDLRRGWFTTAYFHHPDELEAEVVAAGLSYVETVLIEGSGWLLQDLDERWEDPKEREAILDSVRLVERERSLLGLGGHLLTIARAPSR